MLLDLVFYLLAGAVAGFLGGLLGIGGGLLITLALSLTLPALGFPHAEVMHVAVATTLTAIVLTTLSSTIAQLRRKAVMAPSWRRLMPGMVLGAITGAHLSQWLSGHAVRIAIAVFCLGMAWHMAFGHKPGKHEEQVPRSLWLLPAGFGIGTVSAIVGVAGGSMTVPLLTALGARPVRAVATSAAAGLFVTLASALSYMLALHAPSQPLPAGSVGYVFLPAAAATAISSMVTAPLGVRLAHRLPAHALQRAFAAFLLVMGVVIFSGG